MSLLEIRDLTVCYGGIVALNGISFEVQEHEIVTLIGANGAGKSTTLRSIMGLVSISGGSITYDGTRLNGLDTQKIVGKGIVLVPEGRRVFPNLTTLENLRLGGYLQQEAAVENNLERVYGLFPRLKGEQQMLAVGRGLMSHPRLLLLDEPSVGLAPRVMQQMFEAIKKINDDGTTVMVVEQNAAMALAVAHRGYVLEMGRVVLSDTASNLMNNDMVKQAYVGALAG